jgi:hypothetical protein
MALLPAAPPRNIYDIITEVHHDRNGHRGAKST